MALPVVTSFAENNGKGSRGASLACKQNALSYGCICDTVALRGEKLVEKRKFDEQMNLLFWLVLISAFAFLAGTKTTIKRQECRNGQFTLYSDADRNVNAVQDVEWKIKFSDTGWVTFSSCSNTSSVMNCFGFRDKLPVGITLLNNFDGAVTIERSRNASASHDHAWIMRQVHYFDHSLSPSSLIYEVSFTAQCVRIQEGRDLNLTKILLKNSLPCGRVVDIEWNNINDIRFAYCRSYQDCKVTNDSNHPVPAFWNRLQVRAGSLFLTGIQSDDNKLKIRVTIHYKPCEKKARRNFNTRMEKVRGYTIWIFVESGRASQEPYTTPPNLIVSTSRTSTSKSSYHGDVSTVVNTLPTVTNVHFGSPARSGALAPGTRGQMWTAIVIAATVSAVFLLTNQR